MSESYAMDLHIHGTYSGATSDQMVFDVIAEQASYKGLDFVGTGDILHPKWIEKVQEELERSAEGTYRHPRHGTKFVLTVEVEDNKKVHHLVLLPSLDKAEELREKFGPNTSDMNIDGRPSLDLAAPEIVEMVADSDCLIGPSHAFTPWTSIFKEFDSLEECYDDQLKNVDFLELGLSADTYMADRIAELEDLTFLSNSDAHSPWPNKLGREFNRFELSEPTASSLFKSIKRREDLTLNVGLNPKHGKYHLTACSRCYKTFSVDEAKSLDWRCDDCSGIIKKGVSDRVNELADFKEPHCSSFRPDYLHISPLSEVIALAQGQSDSRSKEVQQAWSSLVEHFSDEISILVDVPISELKEFSDPSIGFVIKEFRRGNLEIRPGGGGKYGELKIPRKVIKAQRKENQKTLSDFGE